MASTWGSNPTALREVANMCKSGADITNLRIQILERAIQILEASAWGHWVRPYIEMLRQVIKVLQRVLALLKEFTQILNSNAQEQDSASNTHGSSPGGGAKPPTGGGGGAGSQKANNTLQDLTNMFKSGKELLDALNKDPQPAVTDPAATGLSQSGTPLTPTQLDPAAASSTVDSPANGPEVPAPDAKGTDPAGGRQASPHMGGGGGGGLDSGSQPDRPAAAQHPGQGAVLSRSPLLGSEGALLAAGGPESGAVTLESIPLGTDSKGLPTGVLAGVLATSAGLGMWSAKRTDKADDLEPNLTT